MVLSTNHGSGQLDLHVTRIDLVTGVVTNGELGCDRESPCPIVALAVQEADGGLLALVGDTFGLNPQISLAGAEPLRPRFQYMALRVPLP